MFSNSAITAGLQRPTQAEAPEVLELQVMSITLYTIGTANSF